MQASIFNWEGFFFQSMLLFPSLALQWFCTNAKMILLRCLCPTNLIKTGYDVFKCSWAKKFGNLCPNLKYVKRYVKDGSKTLSIFKSFWIYIFLNSLILLMVQSIWTVIHFQLLWHSTPADCVSNETMTEVNVRIFSPEDACSNPWGKQTHNLFLYRIVPFIFEHYGRSTTVSALFSEYSLVLKLEVTTVTSKSLVYSRPTAKNVSLSKDSWAAV